MVATLRHEPFYQTGTWVDESQGIYAAWSVPDGSFSNGMPLCNERGDVVLIFAGEEFPEQGLAHHLRAHGHTLEDCGPSYLVHLYEEDPSFPACLNGRFQGVLIDRTRGAAMLFNDRYGLQRVYYYESNDAFYFAAESKAILAVRPDLGAIDPRALGEFVSCGCVLENRTLFPGIHVLPPAAAWKFCEGRLDKKATYFQPREWEEAEPKEPEDYYRQLRLVFSKNLPRYFEGRQPIGMSLTGGLDTRMIMAWHKPAPGSLACYTFRGIIRDCQDVVIARKVARLCGQTHQTIPIGEEFLSRFPKYAERTVYLTDGCAAVNHSADLYVNEMARGIAPVRMTGNYGGEVLRRIRAFKPQLPTPELFHPEFLSYVHKANETYDSVSEGHPLSVAVFRQAPWHHYGLLALEQTQLSLRSPYLDNDFVRLVFQAPQSSYSNGDVCARLIADGDQALARIRTDRGGVTGGRFPAIGRALLDFTFKAEYAYDYGMPQSIARIDHILSSLHLERLFLGRHKLCHFRIWYRDSLSRYIREMLLDPLSLSRTYLNPRAVESIVTHHIKGDRNYTAEIHKLLTLELLHRLFSDSRSSRVR